MLAVSPCLALCDWTRSGDLDAQPLFRCAGCGSEWVRSQKWTPRQADGDIPVAVLEELQRG